MILRESALRLYRRRGMWVRWTFLRLFGVYL